MRVSVAPCKYPLYIHICMNGYVYVLTSPLLLLDLLTETPLNTHFPNNIYRYIYICIYLRRSTGKVPVCIRRISYIYTYIFTHIYMYMCMRIQIYTYRRICVEKNRQSIQRTVLLLKTDLEARRSNS